MLRASSLGLSLLVPTTRTFQPCSLLHGASTQSGLRQRLSRTARRFMTSQAKALSSYHIQLDKRTEEVKDLKECGKTSQEEENIATGDSLLSLQNVELEEHGISTSHTLDIPQKKTLSIIAEHKLEQADFSTNPILTIEYRSIFFYPTAEHGTTFIKPLWFYDFKTYQDARRNIVDIAEDAQGSTINIDAQSLRFSLLYTLGRTQSYEQAWKVYRALSDIEDTNCLADKYIPFIPYEYIHRLCRIIVRSPKRMVSFRRLLHALKKLRISGGKIYTYEWNALINHTGHGKRTTDLDQINLALTFYNDMITGRLPGSTNLNGDDDSNEEKYEPGEPDIYTYTTLISMAARSLDISALESTSMLLQTARIAPNRITHLSLLKYHTAMGNMEGLRRTLQKIKRQGDKLGLDGINAVMWSFIINDRLEVAAMLYRLLRNNVVPEANSGSANDIFAIARWVKEETQIVIPHYMLPNEKTYTAIIQAMAYRGDFVRSVRIFMDMLSTENKESLNHIVEALDDSNTDTYSPSFAIYRAIFIGFRRHGIRPPELRGPDQRFLTEHELQTWTLENLTAIFEAFMSSDIVPNKSLIYTIIKAFDETSGSKRSIMRPIWKRLDKRFNGPWGGPESRFRRLKREIFTRKTAIDTEWDDEDGEESKHGDAADSTGCPTSEQSTDN